MNNSAFAARNNLLCIHILLKLAKALGIPDGNHENVLQALGVDYRGVNAQYKGPMLLT